MTSMRTSMDSPKLLREASGILNMGICKQLETSPVSLLASYIVNTALQCIW